MAHSTTKSLQNTVSASNIKAADSEMDLRKMYSLSLSQLRKSSEFGEYYFKPSPFKHLVVFLATDAKGSWLVTGDSGPENIIIIWDRTDYFPQKTLFSPHGSTRISKVALSSDAKYLLTLGYQEKATLYWWIWSFGHDTPDATLEVDIPPGGIREMDFNPNNSDQFLLLTKHDIWIGITKKIFIIERGVLKETDDYELKIRCPPRKASTEVGNLTCYTFVKNTSQIIVGSSRGAVLIYGYTLEYQQNVDSSNFENLRFIKVLKIDQKRISVIKNVDGVIVTGNTAGEIFFYDEHMKLLYWVHGFRVDNVKSLSFDMVPRSYQIFDPKCKWEYVHLLRQGTHNEGIGYVDFLTEKLRQVIDNKISHALALTVHPDKSFVCVGYADGLVELYNFVQHKLFRRVDLRDTFKVVTPPDDDSIRCNTEVAYPAISVTCLKYSPSGLHLACGFNTGGLIFLDPTTVDILTKKPFKDTNHAIKEINFSCDSLTLAFSDVGYTVCVYKYDCSIMTWIFIGKHRAHYKDITAVFFLPQKNENGDYKLISLGADRMMVEYDVSQSSDEYLEIYSLDRMDQSAIPLAGIPWPTPSDIDPESCRTDLPMILVANDEDTGNLFTVGERDSCLYQWAANYRSVENTTKQGGGDLDPYYCLIENGRPGWLFHEIRDLFYYIQILCQGTFSPAMRRVKDYIPIDSLPDLMRALGYFPSEYETPATEIDFEEFVKLYLNHRPAFPDSFKKIKNAFRYFATSGRNGELQIDREEFIEVLNQYGEKFPVDLSWYLLSILYGLSFEDRAAMHEDDISFLPEQISFGEFETNIIGIHDVENVSEYSAMESAGSQPTPPDSDDDE
ncbi:unnamed protein product [Leptidea sinapis]|uniref:Cilia- and flagella-associated protein 251 n=1 Tax=Leptidea sinapis TaxID=189913 RepID=A0A5E4QHV3_9NEOP|nr:unnamed protein product [Leptidea sinapis]